VAGHGPDLYGYVRSGVCVRFRRQNVPVAILLENDGWPISGLQFDVSPNDSSSTFSVVIGTAIRRSGEMVLPGGGDSVAAS
jgi:hypothetical protein